MENQIFESLLQIVNFFNDPKHDTILLKKAGIKADQNIIPIIVRVGSKPMISIGELAEQLGKNHSSTSRQIDKFEKQGLLVSTESQQDRRIREVTLTKAGQTLFQAITKARQSVLADAFLQLETKEVEQIATSLQVLVELLAKVQEKSE